MTIESRVDVQEGTFVNSEHMVNRLGRALFFQ